LLAKAKEMQDEMSDDFWKFDKVKAGERATLVRLEGVFKHRLLAGQRSRKRT